MKTDEGFEIPEEDARDRALHALLDRARFPEASAESEQRLRMRWISLSRKRRIGHARWIVAAAAAIVVIGGLSIELMRSSPTHDEAILVPKMLSNRGADEPERIWREPTMAERLVALRAAKAGRAQKPAQAAPDPVVDRLVRQLGDPLVDRRFQAARELARLQRPQVVPTLSSLVQRDVNRREALAALLLCDDPAARKALDDAAHSCSPVGAQITALKHELRKSS